MPKGPKLTDASDEQLIAATLRGDASSFGTIVERYWNMAVALAFCRIDDAVEAEDVAQESFLKAYSHLQTLRKPALFAGWFSRIIAQQCVDHIRKKARQKRVSSCDAAVLNMLESAVVPNTNPGLSAEQAHFIRRTVRQLPEKSRRLMIMRFVGGLSARQIAGQLGKRHGTVRGGLHRAYKMLRKELAPLLEEVK